MRILAQNLLTFLLNVAYSLAYKNQQKEAEFVKECGFHYTQDNKGNAYLSVNSKVKNIKAAGWTKVMGVISPHSVRVNEVLA